MAAPEIEPSAIDVIQLKQALHTATVDIDQERAAHAVEKVAFEERIRKLHLQLQTAQDENDELHFSLTYEEELVDEAHRRAEAAGAEADQLQATLHMAQASQRRAELATSALQAEVAALNGFSSDSARLLTENLGLARDLSILRTEADHLRSQATAHQGLLAEKLALQRQLLTVQVELEQQGRSLQRAAAKEDGKVAELESEIGTQREESKAALAAARKETQRLEEQLAIARGEVETLKRELTSAKKLKKDGAKDKAKDMDREDEATIEMEKLRKELAQSQHSHMLALQTHRSEWEVVKSTMEEKLNAFRTKLRTTKELLKQRDGEVEKLKQAQAQAQQAHGNTHQKYLPGPDARNPRKRGAVHLDPDATVGTPGDGPARKRAKDRTSISQLGDKSTFSITPFLNRTASIAPESPSSAISRVNDEKNDSDDHAVQSIDDKASPTIRARPKSSKSSVKALAPAPNVATNSRAHGKANAHKKTTISKLENVAEETEEHIDPSMVVANLEAAKGSINREAPTEKATMKASSIRRSLASFATFNEDTAPEKRNKRKLGGPSLMSKTLFDDDDEKLPAKPLPSKGLVGGRNRAVSTFFSKAGNKQASVADDGAFMFSPLKKHRKQALIKT